MGQLYCQQLVRASVEATSIYVDTFLHRLHLDTQLHGLELFSLHILFVEALPVSVGDTVGISVAAVVGLWTRCWGLLLPEVVRVVVRVHLFYTYTFKVLQNYEKIIN